MNLYQILCLIGIPSVVTAINAWIFSRTKIVHNKYISLELGVQALLRSQMITDYNFWSEKGFAPIYAREDFENCWLRYHNLGANGVMDDLHNKFMALPTPPINKSEKE